MITAPNEAFLAALALLICDGPELELEAGIAERSAGVKWVGYGVISPQQDVAV